MPASLATGCRPRSAARRFPPPWSIDELQACFVVKDSAGQKLVIQIKCPSRAAHALAASYRRSARSRQELSARPRLADCHQATISASAAAFHAPSLRAFARFQPTVCAGAFQAECTALLTAVGTHRLRCPSIDRSCVRITAMTYRASALCRNLDIRD